MDLPFLERLDELEKRFKRFKMAGTSDVRVAGNLKTGFLVNLDKEDEGVGGGTPVTGACCLEDGSCEVVTFGQCLLDGGTFLGGPCDPSPCPGACCQSDGTCEELSESDCDDAGGTFQGVGTNCDTTGACCPAEGDCFITTEDCCTGSGGTYQGDDTTCDPDPCGMPSCEGCGFAAFDGSGRFFLTRTYQEDFDGPACCDGIIDCGCTERHTHITRIYTVDPSDCSVSENVVLADCTNKFCDGSPAPGDGICGEISAGFTVMSATYEEFNPISSGCDCFDPCTGGYGPTGVASNTLSDECTP